MRKIIFIAALIAILAASIALFLMPKKDKSLFKFVKTVQITPDSKFQNGALGYIHYVPATDRFNVIISPYLDKPIDGCTGKGFGYKEYTTDMEETGKSGIFSCAAADGTSAIIGDNFYFINMTAGPNNSWIGWHLAKYDAITWKKMAEVDIPLDYPKERDEGPTIAYLNGQLDITGEYFANGKLVLGKSATHHHFFSTDLTFLGEKIIDDIPHVSEVSIIEANNIYYMLGATSFFGDMIMMKYDKSWTYLGTKELKEKAFFPTGAIYDGNRFYVAYIDTNQRINPDGLPFFQNIRLAAFDKDWNLVEDMAVTNFSISDGKQPGSPYLTLHNNRLYVSYVIDEMNPVTYEERRYWQSYVNIYELNKQ